MEYELDLPENNLQYFIQHNKAKWTCDNNHNIKYFTEDEIRIITSSYDTKIGGGAFGDVYRGVLSDGRLVAVKRNIRPDTKEEFAKEVIAHNQINHKNVVRLLGCCIEENAQAMIFEHVSKGNLSDHLHCSEAIISLETRLNIAIDCAEALWCMHSMYRPVVHGDIKPSNILLDDNFHAKISDFGLARLLSGGDTDWTINVKGSIGYMDPTFIKDGCLSPKNDVYSFGVVLVELITKTKPTGNKKEIVERFARFSAKEKTARELFDVDITNADSMKVLEGIGQIAKACLKEKICERPEMNIVVGRLWELRTTLEQAIGKTGRRFVPKGQSILKKWYLQHDANKIASRSSLSVLTTLGIFRRKVPSVIDKTLWHNNVMIFTYKELKIITKNFSTVIGKGYYGTCYMGALGDGTRVSVKILHSNHCQQFDVEGEITIHSRMHHSNIVKLVGCCLKNSSPALVCEYAPNGTLDKHLFKNGSEKCWGTTTEHQHVGQQLLDLKMRYQIALGVARAMEYLHEELQEGWWVLHCDIKPENILLDDHFRPMLCDFGLSKMARKTDDPVIVAAIISTEPEPDMTMSRIRGTRGYMAPEWVIHREPITTKADVYSFGVVLLEIIIGRRSYGFRQESVGSEDWYFPKWVYENYVDHRMAEILDPQVITAFHGDAASVATIERMVKTAIWCLQDQAEMRPCMSKVIKMLDGTVKITEPAKPELFCFLKEEEDDF